MMKKLLVVSLSLIISVSFANQTAEDYQKDQSTVDANKNTVVSTGTSLDPQKTIPNYTANPSQTGYYQGVESYSSDLSQAAQNNLKNDPAGNTVYQAFTTRPQIKVNTQSASIQGSKLIENDSYNITHGISDQYVNCSKKPVNCTTTYQSKTCTTGHPYSLTCKSSVTIAIESVKDWQDVTIPLSPTNVHFHNTPTAEIILPDDEGTVKAISMGIHTASAHWSCFVGYPAYLNGAYISTMHGHCGGGLGDMGYGNNKLNVKFTGGKLTLTMGAGGTWAGNVWGSITVHVKRLQRKTKEVWSTTCPNVPSSCHLSSEKCTDPKSTKIFDGIPVTENCWAKQSDYICGQPESASCKSLENQGCEQTSSVCKDISCQEFNDTYNCPVKQCATQMVCAHDVFCIDGDCVKKDPKNNKHFGQDVSELAAAAGAAKDYSDSGQVSIFNGHPMDCSIDAASFSDCCDPSGWGQSTGLAHCGEDAKKLAAAWKKYRTTYIGEYCAHKDPLGVICLSHKKVYCVFDNKMARIVQDYGRPQLHMSYGSAQNPQCGGFSVDQLQKINFNVIDFVDPIYMWPSGGHNKQAGLAADMKVNSPSESAMNDQINKRIEEDLGQSGQQFKQLKAEAVEQVKETLR